MDINEWLEPGCVVHRLGADSKRQALAVIADLAGPAFAMPAADILDALLAREAQGSTGVGAGVGLPHARLKGLVRMRAVFLRLDQPVAFDAVDDRPVDLLFALFAPEDQSVSPAARGGYTAPAPSGAHARRPARPFGARSIRVRRLTDRRSYTVSGVDDVNGRRLQWTDTGASSCARAAA
jgi:PTS system nitrogen regulatory IIA component